MKLWGFGRWKCEESIVDRRHVSVDCLFVCLKKKLSIYTVSIPPYIDTVILYKENLSSPLCDLGVATIRHFGNKDSCQPFTIVVAVTCAVAVATTTSRNNWSF